MNRFLYCIFKILSYSPVLRITDDSKFNEITKKSTKLRISLFSFNLGIRSCYFFTYNFSTKKKSLKFILNLYDVLEYDKRIKKNGDDYDNYLKELSSKPSSKRNNKLNEKILIEKEYILYKISEEMSIKNKTFNKFLAYLAIIALIIPLYASKLTNILSYAGIFGYKIIFAILLIYCFINLVCLIYSFIKIKEFERTKFSSLRKDKHPSVLNNALLYYEMKNKNVESNMEVSIIKNLEKYVFFIIIISSIILITSNVETWKVKDKKHYGEEIKASENKSILLKSELSINRFIKTNKEKINVINNSILSGKYEKVLIITNKKNHLQTDLKKLFELYKSEKVDVINITNKNLSDNVQIILLGK